MGSWADGQLAGLFQRFQSGDLIERTCSRSRIDHCFRQLDAGNTRIHSPAFGEQFSVSHAALPNPPPSR